MPAFAPPGGLTGAELDAAIKATLTAKQRAERELVAIADYESLYGPMVEAFDELVLFAQKDDFDLEQVSAAEHERLLAQAMDAALVLRALNESFVKEGDEGTLSTVHSLSVEHNGLASVTDVEAARRGEISYGMVRLHPGDSIPDVDLSKLEVA